MFESIKKNLLLPLGGRIGSIVAGALVPYGVHAQSAEMLSIGVLGVAFVAVDLVGSYVTRKKAEQP